MPSTGTISTVPSRVRKACLPCRKSKRRCDGSIPRCELCSRKGIYCHYTTRVFDSPQSRVREEVATPELTHSSTGGSWNEAPYADSLRPDGLHLGTQSPRSDLTCDTTAVYFIAPDVFSQLHLELPNVDLPIPSVVASHVGDNSAVREIAAEFFQSIHRWLPIIPQRVFLAQIFSPLSRRRAELTVLLLCMKLVSRRFSGVDDDTEAQIALYRVCKQFQFEIASSGCLSLQILQAGILIALYEIGQAIYPAAYLTIGFCAQYSSALGLERLNTNLVGEHDANRRGVEIEERRRAWWAVVILDRFLCLHKISRHPVTEDPSFETYLPVDDSAWENGTSKPEDTVTISRGFSLEMGFFSRLAQTIYLLNQALKLIREHPSPETFDSYEAEATQLLRTLTALIQLSDNEAKLRKLQFCPQVAVCISAVLILQEHFWRIQARIENRESYSRSLSTECRSVLEKVSAMAPTFRANYLASDPSIFSIFVLQVMYQVACIDIKTGQADCDQGRYRLSAIKDALNNIHANRRLAGLYLNLLESKEAIIASATCATS